MKTKSYKTRVEERLLEHLQVAARELAEASWHPEDDDTATDDEVREVLARFLRGEVVLANES
jgi:hypothetical protein